MKNFKGTISCLLAVVLVSSFAGCSAGTVSGGSSAAATEQTSLPNSAVTGEHSTTIAQGSIIGVTAITEVFGGGQKVSAVAVEYDTVVDTSKLATDSYTVPDNTIAKVYANTSASMADAGVNGNYVIIELAVDDSASYYLNSQSGPSGGGSPPSGTDSSSQATTANQTSALASDSSSQDATGGQTGGGPGMMMADNTPSNNLTVSVTQIKDIQTENAQNIAANTQAIESTKTINLVVDDFQQLIYKDTNYNNEELMYNLYVPKDYDPSKSYPLVLFMPDASATSTDPFRTLTQGIGATIWATPEEQAKHECFVLAPQYTTQTVDDSSVATEYLDITIDLVKEISSQYSIDTNRIYNTGQSGGGMMSIAMDIKYPDMFAASFLVACQWDATLVTPMADDNLWIVVCNGDTKAYPGMNAITDALVKEGATLSTATWNSEATAAEFATNVSDMIAKGTNINYSIFEGGNHMYTWKVAYKIEGIRDWLFSQVKKS